MSKQTGPTEELVLETLRQVEAFADVPAEGLARIAGRCHPQVFPAGTPLIRQGEVGRTLYFIVRGRVRVERLDARLRTPLALAELGPNEVVGEMAVFSDGRRAASVIAVEDTDTLEIRAEEVVVVMAAVPEVARGFLRVLAHRVRATDEFAEKALDHLNRQHQEILNSVDTGIYAVDAKGTITFINAAAVKLIGYEAAAVMGKSSHACFHHSKPDGAPYPVDDCPIHAAAAHGTQHHQTQDLFWRKDGSSFPVECAAIPLRDNGTITGAVVTFVDISERKAAERMKDEFLSIVSHELRTPLTSIRGSLGLVAGGQLGAIPEKAQHMLDIAVNNSDRLVRLINDLLDIERMESGKVNMEKAVCDCTDLMSQAAEAMRPMAERAGVTLSVEPTSARLWADPDRTVQTLNNLLNNAVKFSPAGGAVSLTAERMGDYLRFEVRDQGRGIPPDKLELIFERFQQVDASDSREKGGSGLGLAICRSIVEQHGGRIWAESTLGEGSRLSFTLPALRDEASAVAPDTDGPHVLVCAEELPIAELLERLLGQRAYRVTLAKSLEEAVEEAAAHQPDAILLDLTLPSAKGWEPLAALKQRLETRDIPIIAFSALAPSASGASAASAAQPNHHQLDVPSLVTALEQALGRTSKHPKVLLVEDDLELAEVLIAVLERHGIETFHAQSGREMIQIAQRFIPDLLILDLILPEGDGFSVVEWLRGQERWRQVPLVVYTVKDLTPSEREQLTLGKTVFFTKGRISPEDFEQGIVRLLEGVVPAQKAERGV